MVENEILNEELSEANKKIKKQEKLIQDLVDLNLWSASKLARIYRVSVYNRLDKYTGNKHERT